MKILGISCGRKMSNTEILVKEALFSAREAGAEIEFVRLQDLTLKPCTGCNACVIDLFQNSGSGACVLKGDDFPFIDEKLMDCDGLILGAPIYEKTPPGQLKILNDRLGPSHDLAFRMIAQKTREEKQITTGKGPDPRSFKPKAASLIAVGGSEWDSLALPMLHLSVLSMQFEVVDKLLVNWVALPSMVALQDQWLDRAKTSGAHLVKSLQNPLQDAAYIGDSGLCPMCHSKLIEVRMTEVGNPVTCAVCGVKGHLDIDGGKITFTVPEEEKPHSHVTLSGKFGHAKELKEVSLVPHPNVAELPKRLEKYKTLEPTKPE